MEKGAMIYEGKAKKLYLTDKKDEVVHYFKDDATAFNAQKKGTILNKGVVNNKVSEVIFRHLEQKGVKTHFIRRLSDREMLTRRLAIFPVEVVIRNVVAGSLAKRLGLDEGMVLPFPLLELFYKNDALGDPMINDYHVRAMKLATDEEMETVRTLAFRINEILIDFFDERGLRLVDFKLEFGKAEGGEILLGDEICPDTCRLWDKGTGERMDKDRFRRDLGKVEEAYQEVFKRVCGSNGGGG